MKVIEILIYGLGVLEFPFDETQKCIPQAIDILKQNTIVGNRIDQPEFCAEGDYWIKDDKHYRLAGFRYVNKETGKKVGKSGII